MPISATSTVSATSVNSNRLIYRFNEMRPLLLALADENISREIQAKVGASDIVQQTMLEAYQHMHTLQPEDDRHIFNWLSKILMNNLRDVSKSFRIAKKRAVKREHQLFSDANFIDRKCYTKQVEMKEELDALSRALTCLPHAHQQILTWRYQEQLSYPEIAGLVGRTEDAVRMLVKRALVRLAREMQSDDQVSDD